MEILTLLRNPAQTLPAKTDICYHDLGQPAPKGQLQAAPEGLCKPERGFLPAEANKRADAPRRLTDPLPCPSIYVLFLPGINLERSRNSSR